MDKNYSKVRSCVDVVTGVNVLESYQALTAFVLISTPDHLHYMQHG